jgi:peptidoglycan/LPS O-acetylase OafA/YrhL
MKTSYSNLDLLRSLAVLSVVAAHLWTQGTVFHLWIYDPGVNQFLHNLSFTGVMFFFAHTCLVLMLSMHRLPAMHRGRVFLIRRAFRIYPLCWVAILLALSTSLSDVSAERLHLLGWRGITINALLAQNIFRSFPSVIGPLWSLPWEVQMYVMLPLFFAFLRRFNRLFVVFMVWLCSSLLAVVTTMPAMPRAFHAAVFLPMFIAGMMAYKLLEWRATLPGGHLLPAWAWPFFILGLFAVQGYAVGMRSFESVGGSGINACVCATLGIAIPCFSEMHAAWIVRSAQQIAKYSYGIYLLHVPALIFTFRYLPGLPIALKLVIFILLTATLAMISFHAIESPLIRVGKRLTQPAVSLSPVSEPQEVGWHGVGAKRIPILRVIEGASSER